MTSFLPRIAAVLALVFVACSQLPPGEPCEAGGEGFLRRDPCEFACLSAEVECPGGGLITPNVCSHGDCDAASGGSACADDQFCVPGWNRCLPLSHCE